MMVVTGTGNADPWMMFDLHATNPTGNTVQFSFYFDIPLVTPFTATDLVHSHLDITLNSGAIGPTTLPDNSSVFIPIFQAFLGNAPDGPGDNDSDDQWVLQPLLSLGTSVLTTPGTTSYDSGNQFAVPPPEDIPPGPVLTTEPLTKTQGDPMSVLVQFNLAPNSDVEVDGNFNAPEPGSLICWAGLGLAFAGVHTWHRRRATAA
jgi:hypothetical protein